MTSIEAFFRYAVERETIAAARALVEYEEDAETLARELFKANKPHIGQANLPMSSKSSSGMKNAVSAMANHTAHHERRINPAHFRKNRGGGHGCSPSG